CGQWAGGKAGWTGAVGARKAAATAADRLGGGYSPATPPSSAGGQCGGASGARQAKEEVGGQSGQQFADAGCSEPVPTAAEDLWREFDECVRIESPERADDHCGGGDRHEPVAEREGILLVVGAVSWNQDQRRKNTEPSKPASSEPGLDDSENGGAGRGKDRFVVGPL